MAILQIFRHQYAHIMQHLEDERTGKTLDFIEQYDPQDESSDSAASQPFAFVAVHVVTIAAGASSLSKTGAEQSEQDVDTIPSPTATAQAATVSPPLTSTSKEPLKRPSTTSSHFATAGASDLCLNVDEAISKQPGLTSKANEALAELRDKVAEGEKIGWWIVYNGDPERAFSDYEGGTEKESDDESNANVEDEELSSPAKTDSLTKGGILGQPLPTLIPQEMKHLVTTIKDSKEPVSHAQDPALKEQEERTPDPPPKQKPPKTEDIALARPKGSKSSFTSNFSFPLGRKSSKVSMPQPKNDDVPDATTLKEINKKEGRRYKFFGGRSDKKTT